MACNRHRRYTIWQTLGATTNVSHGDLNCNQTKHLNDCAAEQGAAPDRYSNALHSGM